MSILGNTLWVDHSGLHSARGTSLRSAIVPIPTGVTPPVNTAISAVTATVAGQGSFTLGAPIEPGALVMALYNGQAYFSPDVSVVGTQVTWSGPALSAGAQLQIVTFAGAGASDHYRLEAVPVDHVGQTILMLDGQPSGPGVLFVDGKAYPEVEGGYEVHGNLVQWNDPRVVLTPSTKVEILYPRSAEAGAITREVTFDVDPTTPYTFTLPFTPTPADNTRAFFRGQTLLPGAGINVIGSTVVVNPAFFVPAASFAHGDRITFLGTVAPVLTPITPTSDGGTVTPPASGLPATYFRLATATVAGAGVGSFPLPNMPSYQAKSLGALNGLVYAQGKGYDLSGQNVLWQDSHVATAAGDRFDLVGLTNSVVGAALTFAELAHTGGQPTMTLPVTAPDPAKVLLIVSGGGTYGGLLHAGDPWVQAVDGTHVKWVGAYDLVDTDKVVAIIPTDATFTSSLGIAILTAASGDTTAVTRTLPRAPVEIMAVMRNGALVPPSSYTLNGASFSYTGPFQTPDELLVIFH